MVCRTYERIQQEAMCSVTLKVQHQISQSVGTVKALLEGKTVTVKLVITDIRELYSYLRYNHATHHINYLCLCFV